ncbi:MAG: trypsin-like peptidase domain-containing protein [Zavarzinella sp.]
MNAATSRVIKQFESLLLPGSKKVLRIFACTLLLIYLQTSLYADGLTAESLKKLKAASVFIKVRSNYAFGTGSGFIVYKNSKTGYIATNAHVVMPTLKAEKIESIDIVLNSGRPSEEKTISGSVVFSDKQSDLAILRIESENIPEPLSMIDKVDPIETMTVYALGFPFGKLVAGSNRNPSITISKGAVTSLREDDDGKLELIQIDADINPGCSGGPVVDEKGRLIGISKAGIIGTNVNVIVPKYKLNKIAQGSLTRNTLKIVSHDEQTISYLLTAEFLDPFKQINKCTLLYFPADEDGLKLAREWDASNPGKTIENHKFCKSYEIEIVEGKAAVTIKTPRSTGIVNKSFVAVKYYVDSKLFVSEPELVINKLSAQVGSILFTPSKQEFRTSISKLLPLKPIISKSLCDLKTEDLATDEDSPRGPYSKSFYYEACAVWSTDYQHFFVLNPSKGILYKLDFQSLSIIKELSFNSICAWLSVCDDGLLVTGSEKNEIYIVDPVNLKTTRTIKMRKGHRAVSQYGLKHIYVAHITNIGESSLYIYEIKTGQLLRVLHSRSMPAGTTFENLDMSKSGEFIYTSNRFFMSQYPVSGSILDSPIKLKTTTSGERGFQISSIGNFVTVSSSADTRPGVTKSTLLLSDASFPEPVVVLPMDALNISLHDDKKFFIMNARIITEANLGVRFDFNGKAIESYGIQSKIGVTPIVVQYLIHPKSSQIVCIAEHHAARRCEVVIHKLGQTK